MKQIVLDAGPLIGFFSEEDTYHEQCLEGFRQLALTRTTLLVPLPIIFETYKWILQRFYPQMARRALQIMESNLQIVELNTQNFKELKVAIDRIPNWTGSLEDATVTLTAVQYRCPVWTYNFRDFSIFESLEFWNPFVCDS